MSRGRIERGRIESKQKGTLCGVPFLFAQCEYYLIIFSSNTSGIGADIGPEVPAYAAHDFIAAIKVD